jgi:hypothetical protein
MSRRLECSPFRGFCALQPGDRTRQNPRWGARRRRQAAWSFLRCSWPGRCRGQTVKAQGGKRRRRGQANGGARRRRPAEGFGQGSSPLACPSWTKPANAELGSLAARRGPSKARERRRRPGSTCARRYSVALRSATGFRRRRQGDWVWSSAALDHRGSCFAPYNVRAEATREVGRPGAAQDNGARDCPARRQGGTPRGVASRARG